MTTYSIACLAGDGIGPEVMAQASRGMRAGGTPARLRARRGARAVRRGRDDALRDTRSRPRRGTPRWTRGRGPRRHRRPALLLTLESELDLRAAVTRVRLPVRRDHVRRAAPRGRVGAGRSTVPLAAAQFEPRPPHARRQRGRLGAARRTRPPTGTTASRSDVSRHDVQSSALVSSREPFDVVVCDRPLLVALAELRLVPRLAPRARLGPARPQHGPGIFGPSHGTATDIAGQGVADPSSMLLAAALMLGEGLGERGAASHALSGGLARARQRRHARRRHCLDDQRADRRRARAAAAVALERRVPPEAV